MNIKKLISDVLTENDGKSFCPVRVFAAGLSTPAILFFIVDCVGQLYHGHLDLQTMATAFATMTGGFAALGIGVAAKAITDTKADSQ
jgi:hypothetical protein